MRDGRAGRGREDGPGLRRLPGGVPIPVLVIGLPLAGLLCVGVAARLRPHDLAHPASLASRTADLVMQDRDDGSIAVLRAGDGRLVDVVPPASNGFLRVMLAGLVRERRREGMGAPTAPFHLTRWSDGRLTVDDAATGKLIELDAFGPDNAGVFARLLDLSGPPPAR